MAVIEGTAGEDNLYGTAGNDTIYGRAGNDRIRGNAGDDILHGEAGDDDIHGGDGNDTIHGGDGNDVMSGDAGDDIVYGEAGDDDFTDYYITNDKLYGGAGNDSINVYHRSGEAVLDGGDDDDYISYYDLGSGDDVISARIVGGNGNDEIKVRGGPLTNISGGAGVDWINIISNDGRANISTGSGGDIVHLGFMGSTVIDGVYKYGVIAISDFTVGNNGDKLYLSEFLTSNVSEWNDAVNPFAAGYFRLVQSGGNAVLQFDKDGSGGLQSFQNIVILQNVNIGDLTARNLGGFAANGSIPTTVTNISGTALADGLMGTQRADVIKGGAGNDLIFGSFGNDNLQGEAGNDTLDGGNGNDVLLGGEGNDELYDGAGNDNLQGGNGDDTLLGGGEGNDKFYGQAGDDLIVIDVGYDDVVDTILIDGGIGNDTLTYDNFFQNDADIVTINGGGGNDIISSQGGARVTIDAGMGSDIINIDPEQADYIIKLGDGRDRISLQYIYDFAAYGSITVNDFVAGTFGDVIDLDSTLFHIETLEHGLNPFATGHLRLIQSGADTLLQLDEDPADPSTGYVTLMTLKDLHTTTLTGKNFQAQPNDANYDLFPRAVRGTNGADTLFGSNLPDLLFGFDGNDSLYGKGGNDTLYGGKGDDRYFIEDAGDKVVEENNEGIDTVITGIDYILDSDAEIEKLWALDTSSTNSLRLTGNELDQQIIGNAGNNVIDGGDGADEMQGLGGNDYYYVDDRGDIVIETANGGGADRVYSSISRILEANVEQLHLTGYDDINGYGSDGDYTNIIVGNRYDNYIYGRGGADFLYGGRGDDTIRGGTGRDILYGGDENQYSSGADIFEFHAPDFGGANAATADRIVDFDASDRIDLSRVDAVTGGADNAFAFIGSGAFTGVAGQLRYQYVSGSTAVQGDMNGDKVADFWIMLDGTHALSTGQFIL